MKPGMYEVRIMGRRRDVVRVFADRRQAEREYARLARAKAHVQLAYRRSNWGRAA